MNAVAFPLVSKRNQLNFQFVPLPINSVVWEKRPHSEREEWTQLSASSSSYARPSVSVKKARHFLKAQHIFIEAATFLEPQFSIQRRPVRRPFAKIAKFMTMVTSSARYACEGPIPPRTPAASLTSSPATQRTALAAAMIEVAICRHQLLEMRGPLCSDGSASADRWAQREGHRRT